jgi:hypothetical protein
MSGGTEEMSGKLQQGFKIRDLKYPWALKDNKRDRISLIINYFINRL